VTARPKTRLSFKEERELAALPARIEALETEQGDLHGRLADPCLYQGGGDAVVAAQGRLAAVEAELAEVYTRWESLEAAKAG
jgi:ATP-binding cassette subfamily F protein uup